MISEFIFIVEICPYVGFWIFILVDVFMRLMTCIFEVYAIYPLRCLLKFLCMLKLRIYRRRDVYFLNICYIPVFIALIEVGCYNTGTPAVNGGTKVPISSCDMWAVIVGAVVGAVTSIFVETSMAIVAPTARWYTSTHWRGECPCNLCLWRGLQWLWWHSSISIGRFSHYLQSFTT